MSNTGGRPTGCGRVGQAGQRILLGSIRFDTFPSLARADWAVLFFGDPRRHYGGKTPPRTAEATRPSWTVWPLIDDRGGGGDLDLKLVT
jgi:hypothetical protein